MPLREILLARLCTRFCAVACALMSLFLVACDEGAIEPNDAKLEMPAVSGANVSSEAFGIPNWLDTKFVRAAVRIPGYGGHYIEKGGTVKLFVTKNGKGSEAIRLLRSLLKEEGFRAGHSFNGQIEAIPADYEFLQLTRWRLLIPQILSEELTLWGTDVSHNRLWVGLKEGSSLEEIRLRLVEAGIDDGALDLRHISLQCETCLVDDDGGGSSGGSTTSSPSLHDHRRPLLAGYRIATERRFDGEPGRCTLGPVGRGPDGFTYAIVPSHCTPSFLGADNAVDFGQPSLSDWIGYEHTDAVNVYSPGHWKCGTHSYPCRHSDAALIHTGNLSAAVGEVAAAKLLSPELDSNPTTYKIRAWSINRRYPGHEVFKIGQTTGLSTGEVVQHCIDGQWTDSDGNTVVFVCHQVTDYASAGGDSGGPVMSWYDQFNRIVLLEGIHHGDAIDLNTNEEYAIYAPAQSGFDLGVYTQGWDWTY